LGGNGDYEIVLVSKENYFVFQPMPPEVISGTIGLTAWSAFATGARRKRPDVAPPAVAGGTEA